MKTLGNIFKLSTTKKSKQTAVAGTKYQCPMKCEGDKLYNAPGNCPVCNMKLAPVGTQGSTSVEREHSRHSQHACCS